MRVFHASLILLLFSVVAVAEGGSGSPVSASDGSKVEPTTTAQAVGANTADVWTQVAHGRHWTSEDLPFLYSQLKDVSAADHWDEIVAALGFYVPDERSIPVLVDLIQRKDPSSLWGDVPSLKASALTSIGQIGGAEADKVLRAALTREGARRLIEKWDRHSTKKTTGESCDAAMEENRLNGNADFFRASAAYGLIYTGTQANHDIVEKLYRELDVKFRGNPRFQGSYADYFGKMTVAERLDMSLCRSLTGAMAEGDLIREIGFREYFRMDFQEGFYKINKYILKYDWRADATYQKQN